jgi:4a-hydroxytetrahydrobiopterin dehydratase
MSTMLQRKDWKLAPARVALTPTQVVHGLAQLDHWTLAGSGEQLAIEKTFNFANYFETMAFVNAVAFAAQVADHHPELLVQYNRCVVRFNTHDVKGISQTDFDCARRIDDLLANGS